MGRKMAASGVVSVLILSLFIGAFPDRANADAVAINGCYLGLYHSDGGYFTTYCGTPAAMAQQALADVNSFTYPDERRFTLASYGFRNGDDHSVFSVNFTACVPLYNQCWGTGNDYGLRCPSGYRIYDMVSGLCAPDGVNPPKNNGPSCGHVGNPCDPGTGNKTETDTDYEGTGPFPLAYRRTYNSAPTELLTDGKPTKANWRGSYDRSVLLTQGTQTNAFTHRPDGRVVAFTLTDGVFRADTDITDALSQTTSGWTYAHRDGTTESYDTNGRLTGVTNPAGLTQSLGYDGDGKLSTVSDTFGNELRFGYDTAGSLATLTDPAGQVIRYTHSANNLARVDYPDSTAKLYHYENPSFPHHLTGISYADAAGTVTRYSTYTYDDQGKATATEHAGGMSRLTLTYDSDSQTTVRDATGTAQTKTFLTSLGVKELSVDANQADGKSAAQTFDANNNLLCRQDEEGNVTSYSYNAANQKTSVTEGQRGTCAAPTSTGATRTTTYQYPSASLDMPTVIESPSVRAGRQRRTVVDYDDSRFPTLPTRVTRSGFTPAGDPVSRSVKLTYNTHGQVVLIDGPRSDADDATAVAYNDCTTGGGCGQPRSVTNAAGHVTTFDSYDTAGRLLQRTDPNGLRTNYQYDQRGRVTQMTLTPPIGGARVTRIGYTPAGNVSTVTFPDGMTLTYTHTDARLLQEVRDNAGNRVTYGYDQRGNRIQTATHDPDGTLIRQIDTGHDARNYVTSINDGGALTRTLNDAHGNLLSETDPKTNPATRHQYDPLSRRTQTTDRLGGTARYDFDTADRTYQVQAPNGATTRYSYNDLGDLLQETSPDRGTTTYTYDTAGNLTKTTEARGITTSRTFDRLGRITAITTPNGTGNLTFTYDTGPSCTLGIGRLCTTQDASGTTAYAYDAFGNVTAQRKTELGRTYLTRYTFDAADRPLTITYPDGRVVTYQRDPLGRVQAVSATVNGTAQTIVSGRTYRPDGPLLAQTYGNGLAETRQYNPHGRLTTQSLGAADTRNYRYDPNGNLISIASTVFAAQYSYDAEDQLTQDQITSTPSSNTTFGYDANGNRTKRGGTTYQYAPGTNRLTSVGGTALAYDQAGNLTKDGTRTYTYDETGRLAQVLINGTARGTYTYNHLGQRTRKTAGATTTVHHYDQAGHLILETSPTGVVRRAYIYADTEPLAQTTRTGGADTLVYLYTDHQGTPRLATAAVNQTVIWHWNGQAYGNTNPTQDPDGDGRATVVNLRWPGMYDDAESSLMYNWHRYYHAASGRYIQPDPAGLTAGVNDYVYAFANPLRFTDPTGLGPLVVMVETGRVGKTGKNEAWVVVLGGPNGLISPIYPGSTLPGKPRECATVQSGIYDYVVQYRRAFHGSPFNKKLLHIPGNLPVTDGFNPNPRSDSRNGRAPAGTANEIFNHPSYTNPDNGLCGCLGVQNDRYDEYIGNFAVGDTGSVVVVRGLDLMNGLFWATKLLM